MNLMKMDEKARRTSRPYEKRNSRQVTPGTIGLGINKFSQIEAVCLGALYKNIGNEKKARMSYIDAARYAELEGNFSRAGYYYSKAGDFRRSRLAMQKASKSEEACFGHFVYDNL